MKFINDAVGEITDSGYSTGNGKITLKIQYRNRAKGFLICVAEIFSAPLQLENSQLLECLDGCVEKSGNSISFTWEEKEYQFFYVTEDKIRARGSELTLPGSVKSPARIEIFWMDEQKNAHSEQEKTGVIVIPISIAAKLERRKKGLLKKEYFCDISLNCLSGTELTDQILYYRVNRKDNCYPVPGHLIQNGKITIKTDNEMTEITLDIFKKYKKFYKLQMSS